LTDGTAVEIGELVNVPRRKRPRERRCTSCAAAAEQLERHARVAYLQRVLQGDASPEPDVAALGGTSLKSRMNRRLVATPAAANGASRHNSAARAAAEIRIRELMKIP
jgi:hypothetical protein